MSSLKHRARKSVSRKSIGLVLTLSALTLATNIAYGKASSQEETAYEGAPSGMSGADAKTLLIQRAPKSRLKNITSPRKRFLSVAPAATVCCAKAPPVNP